MNDSYINGLLDFINCSPVNFWAVKSAVELLEANGFERFDATLPIGKCNAGDKFYVTKNDSSVYAFKIGKKAVAENGFHIICAHSDSPTFRIKPNPEIVSGVADGGCIVRLNTEVYGGAILNTWFDRPLSVAGRVMLRTDNPMEPKSVLVRIERPLMQISNLAIHFNRQVNDGVKLSKQKDTLPILALVNDRLEADNALLKVVAKEVGCEVGDVIDFDLYLYDTTPACTFGLSNEFISAGRIDDLSMVHAGLTALINSDELPETTQVLAVFDNEETGSQTKQGAGSPFLSHLIRRIVMAQGGDWDSYCRAIEKAFMISADNAHAWHPNYSEKYDPTNHPVLGGGPVIKFNAAQKYASDAQSAAVFAQICERAGVPYQRFVNHSDVAGGSTLGNILASSLPMRGVDMGNPVLAMHSVRETASVKDHEYCIKAFIQFYNL